MHVKNCLTLWKRSKYRTRITQICFHSSSTSSQHNLERTVDTKMDQVSASGAARGGTVLLSNKIHCDDSDNSPDKIWRSGNYVLELGEVHRAVLVDVRLLQDLRSMQNLHKPWLRHNITIDHHSSCLNYLGHLAEAFIQRPYNTFVRRKTPIYRCRYSKDVNKNKYQAPTITRLTPSP